MKIANFVLDRKSVEWAYLGGGASSFSIDLSTQKVLEGKGVVGVTPNGIKDLLANYLIPKIGPWTTC